MYYREDEDIESRIKRIIDTVDTFKGVAFEDIRILKTRSSYSGSEIWKIYIPAETFIKNNLQSYQEDLVTYEDKLNKLLIQTEKRRKTVANAKAALDDIQKGSKPRWNAGKPLASESKFTDFKEIDVADLLDESTGSTFRNWLNLFS